MFESQSACNDLSAGVQFALAGSDDRGMIADINRLCCTNQLKESLFESRVIAGGYEQLVPHEVQDHELVGLQ